MPVSSSSASVDWRCGGRRRVDDHRVDAAERGHAGLPTGELRVGAPEGARGRVRDGGCRRTRRDRHRPPARARRRRMTRTSWSGRSGYWSGLLDLRACEAARIARVEKPAASGRGRRSGVLTERCYTGVAGRPVWMGTPVTRSLPARFEAYIAPSALMISSSASGRRRDRRRPRSRATAAELRPASRRSSNGPRA